jgi:hypothetical protein
MRRPPVINRHHYKTLPPRSIYVGRRTALGNPFPDLDRYADHLRDRLQERDAAVLAMMAAIDEGTPLVCSCAPKLCHADVIAAAWLWLKEGSPERSEWVPAGHQAVIR